jgi:ABC-2 type transport system permease protein
MTTPHPGRWRRIRALIIKETLQVARDPSSLIVAFVLPALLLFLFGFGISFDATRVKVGLVIEEPGPETTWFLASLANTPFFDVRQSSDRRAFVDDLAAGHINGIIVLAGDFAERLARGDTAGIQVIPDGSDPNTAGLVNGYLQGAWQSWQDQRALGSATWRRDRSRSSRGSGSTRSSKAAAFSSRARFR